MRYRHLLAFVALVLLAVPIAIGQTTGSVSGVVRDQEGNAVPGVTVSISGVPLPLAKTMTTLQEGRFQFVGLIPGEYTLKAELSGMGAFEQNVVVALSKDTEVRPVLRATATAAVEVSAALPLVDTKATDISDVTTRETLQKLPIARTFTGTFQLAPGVAENNSTAPNAGGGRQDNTFLYDGVNVTNPFFGDLYQDFSGVDIQEVNIMRGGISAEFGRTGGFLVNGVTRSGTNVLHGDVIFEYQPSDFEADAKEDRFTRKTDRYRPAANIGGPIMRDHLFFYGSANLARTTLKERTNDVEDLPDLETDTDEFFLKLTANPLPSHLIDASFRLRDIDSTNAGISQTAAASTALDSQTRDRVGVLSWLWTVTPTFSLEAKFNHNENDNTIDPVTKVAYQPPFNVMEPWRIGRFTTSTALPGYIFPPATLPNQVVGVSDFARDDQKFQRDEYRLAASWLTSFLGGTHNVRFGGSFSDNREDLTRSAQGWGSIIIINSSNCGPVADRPCFRARYFPEQPTQVSEGETWGVFLQDQINWDRLTLNVGVLLNRDEFIPNEGGKFDILRGDITIPNSQVPTCESSPGAATCIYRDTVTFDFDDQIQPRVGVAYVLDKRVNDKIYVNYGRYSNMDNQSFSRSAAPIRLSRRDAFFNRTTGALVTEITRSNNTNKRVMENIDPTKTDEIIGGYARPLGGGWAAEVWGMYRKIDDIIEDFPGFGRETASGNFRYGNIPAYRKYRGITLEAKKAYSDNWTLDVSYTLSRLEGNWDLDYATALFYSSSYIEDGPGLYVLDPNRDGILIGDRTHVGKIFATYELPTNTSIGAYLRYQSGRPWEARGNDPVYFTDYLYLEEAGSRRTSSWTNLDLRVAQRIPIDPIELKLEAGIINVFDSQPELSVDHDYCLAGTACTTFAVPDTSLNPRFRDARTVAPPRRFVLAAALTF